MVFLIKFLKKIRDGEELKIAVIRLKIGRFVNYSLKYLKLCLIYFFSILLLPGTIAIRILRPFLLVRFGTLYSDRIGHYASNTEIYLCKRDMGLFPKHPVDVFFNTSLICNNQLKKMWIRTLYICPFTRLQRPLYIANRLLPGYKKHIIDLSECRYIHVNYDNVSPHLFFTVDEEKKACAELQKIGIQKKSRFVCFLARDSAYLHTIYPRNDWNYHNHRDSNIDNYVPAVEELVRRGYYALRMGAIVNKNLQVNNQRIIDYATKFRTDFMDIYLAAKCDFFISTGIGFDEVSSLFRKPKVYVNFIPLEDLHSWSSKHLIIFKKLWLREDKRFMTFQEILESGAGRFFCSQQYEQAGIEVIENTPNEIKDVAIEMEERLKGTWQTTEEDEELQQRFWALFKSSKFHGIIRARIGRDFLKQNKDLLV